MDSWIGSDLTGRSKLRANSSAWAARGESIATRELVAKRKGENFIIIAEI
jgi:hypothetical protein